MTFLVMTLWRWRWTENICLMLNFLFIFIFRKSWQEELLIQEAVKYSSFCQQSVCLNCWCEVFKSCLLSTASRNLQDSEIHYQVCVYWHSEACYCSFLSIFCWSRCQKLWIWDALFLKISCNWCMQSTASTHHISQ